MPKWFHQDEFKISMYLYDRSQHHGNHNYSHFHVKCLNKESVFNILGDLMEGTCDKKGNIKSNKEKSESYKSFFRETCKRFRNR